MFAKSATAISSRPRAYTLALLPLLLCILVFLSWGVKARGWVWKPAYHVSSALASPQNQSNQAQAMVLTSVNRFGFEPREMTIREGNCQIAIRDAFGSDELNFLIADLGAKNEKAVPLTKHTKEKKYGKAVLRLKAGQYAITEAAHPAWLFTLNVTAR